MMNVGIIGAGKLGIVLAQLSLKAGYSVFISGSGSPEKIKLTVNVLAPGTVAATTKDVIEQSDIIILALPLSKYQTLPTDLFSGKLVIDAMNYWWEVDGDDKALSRPKTSTSELVQNYLSKAYVVKALSHMGYHHLHDEARSHGESGRKAIAIAGDNKEYVDKVAEFIDSIGFDPLPIGKLSAGKKLEPGHKAFGSNVDRASLKLLLQ